MQHFHKIIHNFQELSTLFRLWSRVHIFKQHTPTFQIVYIVKLGPYCSVTSNLTSKDCESEECGLVHALEEVRKKNEIRNGLKVLKKLRVQREKREKGDVK